MPVAINGGAPHGGGAIGLIEWNSSEDPRQ
jgi:hypothetical protein